MSLLALPGGSFPMGSDHHYPEERPAHRASVAGFAIADAPVTVAEFASFVDASGHVTVAESDGSSAVFTPPSHPVDLGNALQWWSLVEGACWRRPDGVREAAADHPVVQIAYADALAYCAWAGVRLPSETEWEYAAQGAAGGNVWAGDFPWRALGLATTSPVRSHPPSPSGLFDAVGNVWEWTTTPWTRDHQPVCCSAPLSTRPGAGQIANQVASQVAKGGSFLCSADYCARYRPQARIAMAVDSPSCHLGFRVAADPSSGL